MFRNFCLQVIRVCAYLIVFSVPLLVNVWSQVSFEIIKNVAFRSLVEVMVVFWIAQYLWSLGAPVLKREGSLWDNGIFYSGLISCFTILLSTFTALNVHLSFFGSYMRAQGLLTHIHYWLFFLIVVSVFRDIRSLWKLALFAVGGGLVVSVLGIFQMFGYDYTSLFGVQFTQARLHEAFRVLSTMGQPNFLGQYLVMLLPFSLAGIFRFSGRLSTFCGGASFFMVIALIGTLSRAAWIGLFAFLGLFAFGYLLKRRSYTLLKRLSVLFAALFAALVFINVVDTPLKNSDISTVRRISKIFDSGSPTAQSRLYNWLTAFHITSYSPLVGFGPESYSYMYAKYQPEEMLDFEASDKFADRAHNHFLDRVVTTGYMGLLSSIIFGFSILYVGIRSFVSSQDQDRVWLMLASICGLVAFFLANMFGFALTAVTMTFWLLVAILMACVCLERGAVLSLGTSSGGFIRGSFIALFGIASFILIYTHTASGAIADVYFKNGSCAQCDHSYLDTAISLAPTNGYYGFYKAYYLVQDAEKTAPAYAVPLYEEAAGLFRESYLKTQRAGDYYLNMARLYRSWALIDPVKHEDATSAYEMASGATPHKPRLYAEWAAYLEQQAQYEEALGVYARFAELYNPKQDMFAMNSVLRDFMQLADSLNHELYPYALDYYTEAESLR